MGTANSLSLAILNDRFVFALSGTRRGQRLILSWGTAGLFVPGLCRVYKEQHEMTYVTTAHVSNMCDPCCGDDTDFSVLSMAFMIDMPALRDLRIRLPRPLV